MAQVALFSVINWPCFQLTKTGGSGSTVRRRISRIGWCIDDIFHRAAPTGRRWNTDMTVVERDYMVSPVHAVASMYGRMTFATRQILA